MGVEDRRRSRPGGDVRVEKEGAIRARHADDAMSRVMAHQTALHRSVLRKDRNSTIG